MNPLLSFSPYDATILWNFFDGVSDFVAKRMQHESPPQEEKLTFLLGELLDENSTGDYNLNYPLSSVKEDLGKSDTGITLDIKFETHEHSKFVESKFSGADLGVVFHMEHPILGQSHRAVLLQAKKLFHPNSSKFTLYSEYSSYKSEQADFLKKIQSCFAVNNAIYYVLYNPPTIGFAENDAKRIRAFEAMRPGRMNSCRTLSFIVEDLLGRGIVFDIADFGRSVIKLEEHEGQREWRNRQPAIRISELDTVQIIASKNSRPQLIRFYEMLMQDGRWTKLIYSPFADFFLLGLFCDWIGSSDERWIQLAEGQRVPMPKLIEDMEQPTPDDNNNVQTVPIPRHTITLTLRSTLPNVG